jgi:hypothetical protein
MLTPQKKMLEPAFAMLRPFSLLTIKEVEPLCTLTGLKKNGENAEVDEEGEKRRRGLNIIIPSATLATHCRHIDNCCAN